MSAYIHRLLVICPVGAKATALNAWIAANLTPLRNWFTMSNWLSAGISATGSAPATHLWFTVGLDDDDCIAVLVKLCQLASITPPTLPTWRSWTHPQKIAWLQSVQAGVLSGWGLYVNLYDNLNWSKFDADLAAMNLLRIGP